jgi:hypothetical protein
MKTAAKARAIMISEVLNSGPFGVRIRAVFRLVSGQQRSLAAIRAPRRLPLAAQTR